MADKLQQGINVLTTFVDGETPTAAKLNSITAQLKNASQQLEKAVGDIHDQSYPYSSSTAARLSIAYGRSSESAAIADTESRRLDIANLARLIGPSSNLNPPFLGGSKEITEIVPAGVTEFSLQYPPTSISTVSFTKTGVGEPFQTRKISSAFVNGEGHYHIDSLGRVFTTLETDSTDPGTVTYTTDSDSWLGGPNYLGARFNVIPDPNQLSASGEGCAVGGPPDAQGRRPVTLPVVTHAQYDHDMDAIALTDADANYQEQLYLPQILTESYTTGEIIPGSFLVLKNWTTGEVYDAAEYIYNSSTSVLIGAVDITTEVDRGDKFVLITVGTDITTSIDDLRRKMRHGHDRSFGEPLVPADSIGNWTAGPWSSKGSYTVSGIPSNYSPQYLHRDGYSSAENNWNDNNIMRGDLVIGLYGGSPSSYLGSSSTSADTYKVAFGHPDNAYLEDTSAWFKMYSENSGILLQAPNYGIQLISGADTYFKFEEYHHYQYSGQETHFLEEDSVSRAYVKYFVSNQGLGGIDGLYGISSLKFNWKYQDSNSAALMSVKEGGANSQFSVECNADGSTDSVIRLAEVVGGGSVDLLNLHIHSLPENNNHYIKFTGYDGGVNIYGSIRGTDDPTDPVFYSYHSSNKDSCQEVSVGAAVTAQDAGHIKFVSGGSDYGEWLRAGDLNEWEVYFKTSPRKDSCMGLPEGLVVFVREGLFYRVGPGTPMAITNRAIVVGNLREGQWPANECEILSFVGQVPVMCYGAAKSGDLLLPNPDEPGTTIAIDPDECTFVQYRQALGTVWKSSEEEGLKHVLCAIGKK